jgi:hypothetical protein
MPLAIASEAIHAVSYHSVHFRSQAIDKKIALWQNMFTLAGKGGENCGREQKGFPRYSGEGG